MKKLRALLIGLTAGSQILAASAFAAEQIRFSSSKISCSSCAKKITRVLQNDARVQAASVDVEQKLVTVTLKKGKKLSDADLLAVIEPTHYPVENIQRD